MRPLDGLRSIKLKLSVAIVAAVAVTVLVVTLGTAAGVSPILSAIGAGVLSLWMVHVLARGMTSPLREMARAAEAMARGDYDRRVTATSGDEVGDLARAFNAMAADLAVVDSWRRDLVANVSHELRTPITALHAMLENQVDGVAPPDPDALHTMLAQVERLGRLVSQLLDLSRLESGVVPLQVQAFDVEPVLQQAATELRLHAPDVAVDVGIAGSNLTVSGDRERVHQVVANLLENAARFSPPGGKVALRARSEGGRVTIEVEDEGPGIADADADRVFDRFYRADQARSSREGGAGLGLSIARWIVDLHGGEIRPERGVTRGCRMVVVLPAGR